MKRILTLSVLLLAAGVLSAQGIKKPAKKNHEQPKTEQPAKDSVVIRGEHRRDTVKIVALLYVEDGTITWVKGYMVASSFVPTGGQPMPTGQALYNNKFEAIKPEDVYDVRQLDWK